MGWSGWGMVGEVVGRSMIGGVVGRGMVCGVVGVGAWWVGGVVGVEMEAWMVGWGWGMVVGWWLGCPVPACQCCLVLAHDAWCCPGLPAWCQQLWTGLLSPGEEASSAQPPDYWAFHPCIN